MQIVSYRRLMTQVQEMCELRIRADLSAMRSNLGMPVQVCLPSVVWSPATPGLSVGSAAFLREPEALRVYPQSQPTRFTESAQIAKGDFASCGRPIRLESIRTVGFLRWVSRRKGPSLRGPDLDTPLLL